MSGKVCKNCSAELSDSAIFCSNCGTMVEKEDLARLSANEPLAEVQPEKQGEFELTDSAGEQEAAAHTKPEDKKGAAEYNEPAGVKADDPPTIPAALKDKSQTPSKAPEESKASQPAPAALIEKDRQNSPASRQKPAQTVTVPEIDKNGKRVSTWGFVGVFYLMMIPVVNLILLLIWAFGGAKRRTLISFARACFLVLLINVVLVSALIIVLFIVSGGEPFAAFREFMGNLPDFKHAFGANWFSGLFNR